MEISDKKWNFMNNQITVIITIVSPPHGRGTNEKKRDFKLYFGRNERQLISSANDNKLCLFYALELARIYHDEKQINLLKKKGNPIPKFLITHWSFLRVLKDDLRKFKLATQLLNEIGVDHNRDSYGIEVLPLVQDFYDKEYPGIKYYSFFMRLYFKDYIESLLLMNLQK